MPATTKPAKQQERFRTSLYFRRSFIEQAKRHCARKNISMSRWLEEIGRKAMQK